MSRINEVSYKFYSGDMVISVQDYPKDMERPPEVRLWKPARNFETTKDSREIDLPKRYVDKLRKTMPGKGRLTYGRGEAITDCFVPYGKATNKRSADWEELQTYWNEFVANNPVGTFLVGPSGLVSVIEDSEREGKRISEAVPSSWQAKPIRSQHPSKIKVFKSLAETMAYLEGKYSEEDFTVVRNAFHKYRLRVV